MTLIKNFMQVRADGKLVPPTTTVGEMISLGWQPSKVIALRWSHDGRQVEVEAPNGIHGVVVPGANYVAALYSEDEADPHWPLVVLSADGSKHGEVRSPLSISLIDVHGAFGWFEQAMVPRIDTFGAIFQTDMQAEFRCDIDAEKLVLTKAVKAS